MDSSVSTTEEMNFSSSNDNEGMNRFETETNGDNDEDVESMGYESCVIVCVTIVFRVAKDSINIQYITFSFGKEDWQRTRAHNEFKQM